MGFFVAFLATGDLDELEVGLAEGDALETFLVEVGDGVAASPILGKTSKGINAPAISFIFQPNEIF